MIRFLSPWWLLALLPVLALAGVVRLAAAHRRAFAVRFSNVDLLRAVAPGGIGKVRRHAPAGGAAARACCCWRWRMAKPSVDTKEPLERATVMLALDVSLSMQANDVAPTRIVAAQTAAKDFVAELPAEFNVGLVSFAKAANVIVSPTKDHEAVVSAIDGLQLAEATATGEAVFICLDAIATVPSDGAPGRAAGPDRAALRRLPHVRTLHRGRRGRRVQRERAGLDDRVRHRRRHRRDQRHPAAGAGGPAGAAAAGRVDPRLLLRGGIASRRCSRCTRTWAARSATGPRRTRSRPWFVGIGLLFALAAARHESAVDVAAAVAVAPASGFSVGRVGVRSRCWSARR